MHYQVDLITDMVTSVVLFSSHRRKKHNVDVNINHYPLPCNTKCTSDDDANGYTICVDDVVQCLNVQMFKTIVCILHHTIWVQGNFIRLKLVTK